MRARAELSRAELVTIESPDTENPGRPRYKKVCNRPLLQTPTTPTMASHLKEEIQAANVKFMACFDSADWDELAALYTPDCRLMPTGAPLMVGRDGVKAVFSGVNKAGASKVRLTVMEVGELDSNFEMAYERSQYQFLKEDGSVMDTGKYIVLWKKIDGQWFLYTDIFNTNGSS